MTTTWLTIPPPPTARRRRRADRCVQHRARDGHRVALVKTGQGATQVDRHALGDARGDPQHRRFAVAARQDTGLQRRHRRLPVHPRHRPAVRPALAGLDNAVDEVVALEPAPVADQQLNRGLGRVQARRARAQRCRHPLPGAEHRRPVLRVEHRKAGLKTMAKTLEKATSAVWQESDLQRQCYKMCHNAAIQRSSGIYTGYDPTTDEIYFEVLTNKQILCDPVVTEAGLIDRGEYLFIERIKPLSDLRLRFPGRGAQVKPDSSLVNLNRGVKTVDSPVTDLVKSNAHKAPSDAIERAKVWEGFIRDRQMDLSGKRLFPGYRHIIHTNDIILSDMPLSYWDGHIPVDWFDWAVDPEHPWGLSAISLLRRLQLSFNNIMDGTVENTLISNFISIIGDHDAIDDKRWKELQKIRSTIVLRKTGQNKAITVTPPEPYGADKVMLAKTLFNFAQLIFGVTDVTLGESPGSLQSGVAIEGLQEGANLMTRGAPFVEAFTQAAVKAVTK